MPPARRGEMAAVVFHLLLLSQGLSPALFIRSVCPRRGAARRDVTLPEMEFINFNDEYTR